MQNLYAMGLYCLDTYIKKKQEAVIDELNKHLSEPGKRMEALIE